MVNSCKDEKLFNNQEQERYVELKCRLERSNKYRRASMLIFIIVFFIGLCVMLPNIAYYATIVLKAKSLRKNLLALPIIPEITKLIPNCRKDLKVLLPCCIGFLAVAPTVINAIIGFAVKFLKYKKISDVKIPNTFNSSLSKWNDSITKGKEKQKKLIKTGVIICFVVLIVMCFVMHSASKGSDANKEKSAIILLFLTIITLAMYFISMAIALIPSLIFEKSNNLKQYKKELKSMSDKEEEIIKSNEKRNHLKDEMSRVEGYKKNLLKDNGEDYYGSENYFSSSPKNYAYVEIWWQKYYSKFVLTDDIDYGENYYILLRMLLTVHKLKKENYLPALEFDETEIWKEFQYIWYKLPQDYDKIDLNDIVRNNSSGLKLMSKDEIDNWASKREEKVESLRNEELEILARERGKIEAAIKEITETCQNDAMKAVSMMAQTDENDPVKELAYVEYCYEHIYLSELLGEGESNILNDDFKNKYLFMSLSIFSKWNIYGYIPAKYSEVDKRLWVEYLILAETVKNLNFGIFNFATNRKIFTPEEMKIKKAEREAYLNTLKAEKIKEKEAAAEKRRESLLNELNSLIGINSVKKDVEELINLLKYNKILEEKSMTPRNVSKHMVFTGNPGTGKTTVARIIAEIYKEFGVVSKGQFVETDRSGLIGQYIGHTESNVKKVVKSAIGGVLFIDEAYALVPDGDNGSDFGHQAVATLIKLMEDNKDDLVVIVAGYKEEMKKFIDSNPGLQSRFTKYFEFDDYTPEEMQQIFDIIAEKEGYTLTEDARLKLMNIWKSSSKQTNFGNGRGVRNVYEKVFTLHASRVIKDKIEEESEIMLVTQEDIP